MSSFTWGLGLIIHAPSKITLSLNLSVQKTLKMEGKITIFLNNNPLLLQYFNEYSSGTKVGNI